MTKGREAAPAGGAGEEPRRLELASTRNVVEKNLFDPERGAGRINESEASAIAMQRIRGMTLLGTAILGASRYAIMQQPSGSRPPASKSQPGSSGQLRLKLGDIVEGFKLSEIRERSVVFTKGASRVEVAMDFFRPGEAMRPMAPIPPRPVVAPRADPRGLKGAEPAKQDSSTQGQKASKTAGTERQLQPPQQPERRPPQRAPSKEEGAPAESP